MVEEFGELGLSQLHSAGNLLIVQANISTYGCVVLCSLAVEAVPSTYVVVVFTVDAEALSKEVIELRSLRCQFHT